MFSTVRAGEDPVKFKDLQSASQEQVKLAIQLANYTEPPSPSFHPDKRNKVPCKKGESDF